LSTLEARNHRHDPFLQACRRADFDLADARLGKGAVGEMRTWFPRKDLLGTPD
jgi:hypothetical protein